MLEPRLAPVKPARGRARRRRAPAAGTRRPRASARAWV